MKQALRSFLGELEGGAAGKGGLVAENERDRDDRPDRGPSAVETGILVGILIGEGHFGGDGKQPHVTLRMHTDHAALFEWIVHRFGGKLYGPYHHGGRSYYQWMARGQFLRETLLPILEAHLRPQLDAKSFARYRQMRERYDL